jgi:hydroxymethylpyrimidine/phosphomethylpyrimidine kinase
LKPVALTIAGSDPSGGAGIQADLKTFHQYGVYGEAVLTLLTVQNTERVSRVEILDPELVIQQIEAVLEDIPPSAAKLGALGDALVIRAIAGMGSFGIPLVIDPVMVSKHGAALMREDSIAAFRDLLIPRAFLLTPNLLEAQLLTGLEVSTPAGMVAAAERLREMGAQAVLVKGGHLEGAAVDLLVADGLSREFPAERIETAHTHGTGCTYSAAITAGLALGLSLSEAVQRAKAYVTEAIRTNPGLGRGNGPVNHHARS